MVWRVELAQTQGLQKSPKVEGPQAPRPLVISAAQLSPRAYRPSGLVGMSVPLVYQPMTNLGALFLKYDVRISYSLLFTLS